jgi:hypothetical protein
MAVTELPRRTLLLALWTLQPLSSRLCPSARLSLPVGESAPGALHYPSWLEGTWEVTSTIESFTVPLGTAFVDPFTLASAEEDISAEEQLRYLMRFLTDAGAPGSCIQDRGFNGAQEAAAFLGAMGDLVSCAYTIEPQAPHGRLSLAFAAEEAATGSREGSAAADVWIDIMVKWQQSQRLGDGAYVTSELLEQRVSQPGEMDQVSLVESITRFEPPESGGAGGVSARNRLAQYYSPDGVYAAMARERAVASYDYSWRMQPVGADRVLGGTDVLKARRI